MDPKDLPPGDWDDYRPPPRSIRSGMQSRWIVVAILLGSVIIALAILAGASMVTRHLEMAFADQMWPRANQGWPRGNVQLAVGAEPVPASGVRVTKDTPLQVGSKVLAPDGGQWWRAEVLAVEEDRTVVIHYTGWARQFDRPFRREQLQLDQ